MKLLSIFFITLASCTSLTIKNRDVTKSSLNSLFNKFSQLDQRKSAPNEYQDKLLEVIESSSYSHLLQCHLDRKIVAAKRSLDFVFTNSKMMTMKATLNEDQFIAKINIDLTANPQMTLITLLHELKHICQFAEDLNLEKTLVYERKFLNELEAFLMMIDAYDYFSPLDSRFESQEFNTNDHYFKKLYSAAKIEIKSEIFSYRVFSWYKDHYKDIPLKYFFNTSSPKSKTLPNSILGNPATMHEFKNSVQIEVSKLLKKYHKK